MIHTRGPIASLDRWPIQAALYDDDHLTGWIRLFGYGLAVYRTDDGWDWLYSRQHGRRMRLGVYAVKVLTP